MSPLEMRSRPADNRTANVSAANFDGSSLDLDRCQEIQRRQLNCVADRLNQFDRPAAALARYFAEVAA